MSNDDSLANSSLSTSRVPPQDGRKPDSMPTTRTLPGNDHQKGLEQTGTGAAPRGEGGRTGSEAPGKRSR